MTFFIPFYQQLRIILQMTTHLLWKNYSIKNQLDVQNLNECEVALFNENKLIANPGKLQAKSTDKKKQVHTNEIFKIGTKEIKVASN